MDGQPRSQQCNDGTLALRGPLQVLTRDGVDRDLRCTLQLNIFSSQVPERGSWFVVCMTQSLHQVLVLYTISSQEQNHFEVSSILLVLRMQGRDLVSVDDHVRINNFVGERSWQVDVQVEQLVPVVLNDLSSTL